jgi:hypothetical protein
MTTLSQERERGAAVEIHGFSCESRTVMLPRLHRVLAASGCWLVRSKRGGRSMEYSVEIELAASMDLYCGLIQAGLEMTELTHRTLTELCVLRRHAQALSGPRHVVRVRLVMSFVEFEDEMEVSEVMAASA